MLWVGAIVIMCSGQTIKTLIINKGECKINERYVLVASVIGENENYFSIANFVPQDNLGIDEIAKKFKESACKYCRVNEKSCEVTVSPANSITVAAIIETNNRADGNFKDMDKKCFDFLIDAVKSVQAEQLNNDLYKMLGSIADMI